MVLTWKKASLGVLLLSSLFAGGISSKGTWSKKYESAKAPDVNLEASVQPLIDASKDELLNAMKQAEDQPKAPQPPQVAKPEPKQETAVLASRSGQPAKTRVSTAQPVKNQQSGTTLTMIATAYGPFVGNKTYLGTPVRLGVIAVDPKVIPLGTRVWISGYKHPNLPPNGFMAVAEDVGGAIHGNRIDIFINADKNTVLNFGMQKVQVRILGK